MFAKLTRGGFLTTIKIKSQYSSFLGGHMDAAAGADSITCRLIKSHWSHYMRPLSGNI